MATSRTGGGTACLLLGGGGGWGREFRCGKE